MAHLLTRTAINAPPNVVFAALSDFQTAPQRVTGITRVEMLTTGPVGKGTRFRETRRMFGKEASETMTVVQWDPPREYALEAASCGCHYHSTIACTPDGSGTSVSMTFVARPLTFMAKLFWPLGRLMIGSCRKMIEKDLTDIKNSIESGGAQAAPSAQPA